MSTIQLHGALHPIDFKTYEKEELKKTSIDLIKYVALGAIVALGQIFFVYTFATIPLTAALVFLKAPPFPTFILNYIYNIFTALLCYTSLKIFSNVVDLINHAKIIKKLEQKKEDAVIIQSPDMPITLSTAPKNLCKSTQTYRLILITLTKQFC